MEPRKRPSTRVLIEREKNRKYEKDRRGRLKMGLSKLASLLPPKFQLHGDQIKILENIIKFYIELSLKYWELKKLVGEDYSENDVKFLMEKHAIFGKDAKELQNQHVQSQEKHDDWQ